MIDVVLVVVYRAAREIPGQMSHHHTHSDDNEEEMVEGLVLLLAAERH